VNGAAHPLPTGAEGAVLELLLLNAGRVVPATALVDALWGEDLPANATNALQGRVSRLRRALVDAGLPADALVTRRPGYLLDIDPDRVDAHRFTRLVGAARRLADTGSPDAAIERYEQALALWRGEPLAEFADAEWARAEATRLDELRLAAVEERIALHLAAGRHGDVVAELDDLTARHPLREHPHAQLMLALYRSGRQAEALEVYQRLRRTLSEELGLAPSAEVRDLEQAILRQDPGLDAPPRPAPPQPTPVPAPVRVNLPARLTSFVGRDTDLAEVRGLLTGSRLVTLTGPGGAGKTSLAVAAATGLAEECPDGVWLVRLAGVTEPGRVAAAVADTVGVPDSPAPVEDRLTRYLRDRAVLVLLDNCEHLVDACAALAERLLVACPRLRLLATSREALAVPGEVQFAVAPLDVPPPTATVDEVARYAAVRLFVDRARAVLPGFALDDATAPHVRMICRRLDGLPLAIELAATRVKTLPVEEIATRLDDRFRLLTSGARTAEARQQTLRATVEWSHHLLPEPERVLFRRLSVFAGGWSLAAAEAVCSGPDLDPRDVVGLVTGLVDRSLVVADRGEGARFRMLETLRQYAAEQRGAAGETDRLGAAHAEYFTTVAEHAAPRLRGPEQGRWLRRLAEEGDNLRTALSWCHSHAGDHPDLGLRLVAALGWFWYFASNTDGRHEVDAMLAAASHGSASARAQAMQAHAVVARPRSCVVHPDPACARSARESLDLFTRLDRPHDAAMSKTLLAVEAVTGTDTADAARMLAEAAEAFAADEWGRALVLFVDMELHATTGRLDEATALADRALGRFRDLGDHWGISAVQYHLGLALHRAGRLARARDVYGAALAEGRRIGLANTVQYLLAGLGHIAVLLGDDDGAERLLAEALGVAHELGTDASPVAALGQGLLARRRGRLAEADDHYRRAESAFTGAENLDWAAVAVAGRGFVAELSGDFDTAEHRHRRAWHLAERAGGTGVGAVAVEGLACVAAGRGDGPTAAALLGAAARWRTGHGRPAAPAEQADIDRGAARTRKLLGDREYEAAVDHGAPYPGDLLERPLTRRVTG
jgi:predicted ATPase/DNA-binding SARP family transcriptional activator